MVPSRFCCVDDFNCSLELDRPLSFWAVGCNGELGCSPIVGEGNIPGCTSRDRSCNPVVARSDSPVDKGNNTRSDGSTSVVETDGSSVGLEDDLFPAVSSGLLEEGSALLRFLPSGTGGPSPPSGIPRVPRSGST